MYTDVYMLQAVGDDLKVSVFHPVLGEMKWKLVTVVSLHLKLCNPALKIYKGSLQWAMALHNGRVGADSAKCIYYNLYWSQPTNTPTTYWQWMWMCFLMDANVLIGCNQSVLLLLFMLFLPKTWTTFDYTVFLSSFFSFFLLQNFV